NRRSDVRNARRDTPSGAFIVSNRTLTHPAFRSLNEKRFLHVFSRITANAREQFSFVVCANRFPLKICYILKEIRENEWSRKESRSRVVWRSGLDWLRLSVRRGQERFQKECSCESRLVCSRSLGSKKPVRF
ncbi:hypothetical protein MHYP_G00331680, partial [Metynnis hypsauchen]